MCGKTILALAAGLLAATGAAASAQTMLTMSIELETTWVRNFNPFNQTSARHSTRDFIYEPLVVFNQMENGKPYHRLAESFTLADDLESVVFGLRDGLKWSDGQKLTADDVKFTFDLMKQNTALDFFSIWQVIDGVEVLGPTQVKFTFTQANALAPEKIAEIPVVPAHIWKDIADPVTYLNQTPVGSGPMTEVTRFTAQVYEQCRNPHYWDAATLRIDCLRFPQLANNDQVLTAAASGELDWFGSFVPDIEKTYVAGDPTDRKYWFPSGGVMAFALNLESRTDGNRKAFQDIRFRRAVSMAMDRDAMVNVAGYGYPTLNDDPGSLGRRFADWENPEVAAAFGQYGRYDIEAARALLDQAGYQDADGDGDRDNPDGSEISFDVIVPNGWTDFVSTVQIAVEGMADLGLDARLATPEAAVWRQQLVEGTFEAAINGHPVGSTPYDHYDDAFHSRNRGRTAFVAQRWFSPEVDALLDDFTRTTDEAKRREVIQAVQWIVAENQPLIPVFNNPVWYEYSTKRFTGFASADKPFVSPQTHNGNHDRLLHLLALRPVG